MKLRDVATILALSGALAACTPKKPGAPQAPPVAPVSTFAAAIYPSLAGSPVVMGDPAELARWVIKGQRPATMPAGRYPTQMLQFGWMKPAQAAALLSYLRLNFGNSGTPVDAAAVARALGQ